MIFYDIVNHIVNIDGYNIVSRFCFVLHIVYNIVYVCPASPASCACACLRCFAIDAVAGALAVAMRGQIVSRHYFSESSQQRRLHCAGAGAARPGAGAARGGGDSPARPAAAAAASRPKA